MASIAVYDLLRSDGLQEGAGLYRVWILYYCERRGAGGGRLASTARRIDDIVQSNGLQEVEGRPQHMNVYSEQRGAGGDRLASTARM